MLVPLKTNFQIVMLKRGLSPLDFALKSVAKMLEAMVEERLP